uniref:hypothetical protein n=1 Tax=Geobacillus sp. (strain Y412MC10) TaxID=481743 RepID=UPI001C92EC76
RKLFGVVDVMIEWADQGVFKGNGAWGFRVVIRKGFNHVVKGEGGVEGGWREWMVFWGGFWEEG